MDDQKDTIIYELAPSPGFIEQRGNSFNVSEASCVVRDFVTKKILPDMSGMCIKYITSDNPEALVFTKTVPVGNWSWINFLLCDEQNICIDTRLVPVIRVGQE
jgi:hypothetical protein